jgi:hypothetical protein
VLEVLIGRLDSKVPPLRVEGVLRISFEMLSLVANFGDRNNRRFPSRTAIGGGSRAASLERVTNA